jgi:hypothetical protein
MQVSPTSTFTIKDALKQPAVGASGRRRGNSFGSSDVSVRLSAPQEPVRSGALQCTDKADVVGKNSRMPAAMR